MPDNQLSDKAYDKAFLILFAALALVGLAVAGVVVWAVVELVLWVTG